LVDADFIGNKIKQASWDHFITAGSGNDWDATNLRIVGNDLRTVTDVLEATTITFDEITAYDNEGWLSATGSALNMGSPADGAQGTTVTVTVTDARVGDLVHIKPQTAALQVAGIILDAKVTAQDTVSIRPKNESGAGATLTSVEVDAIVEKYTV
jgi:hypothetical protein